MAHYGPGGQLAGQVANKSNILSCTRVKYSENPASTESETLPLRTFIAFMVTVHILLQRRPVIAEAARSITDFVEVYRVVRDHDEALVGA